jgi:hypothetical protein
MTNLQNFELFPKLPSELRQQVWKAALPSYRVIYVRAHPLELEDDFWEREQMMYEEDLFGKDTENEDTRSVPEKDIRLLVHKIGQGLDGGLKRQSQLHKYGFMSSRRAPNIAHVFFHDHTTYQGFGVYEPNPIPARRDVRVLLHLLDGPFRGQRKRQAQLHRYGFTTSRPGLLSISEWITAIHMGLFHIWIKLFHIWNS